MIQPRAAVQAISAYSAPPEGRHALIRLDFNENTVGFPDLAPAGVPPSLLCTYPEYGELLGELSAVLGVPAENLLLTNGSEEAFGIIPATFIEQRRDVALVSRPAFPLIPHYLLLSEALLVEVPVLPGLRFDLDGIEAALAARPVKLAIFSTPDNPTGAVLDPARVRAWMRAYPETLFVIDEAYTEYTDLPSLLPEAVAGENLLVLRTFSKAWGLAGLRLGVVAGPPRLLEFLRRVRLPYSVNALAVEVVRKLLPQAGRVRAEALATMARKARLVAALRAQGRPLHEGAANFLLLDAGADAQRLVAFCHARGLLVRDRSRLPGAPGLVRVSVGTDEENQALLAALAAFEQSPGIEHPDSQDPGGETCSP